MIYLIIFFMFAFLFIFVGGIVAANMDKSKKWSEIYKEEGRD